MSIAQHPSPNSLKRVTETTLHDSSQLLDGQHSLNAVKSQNQGKMQQDHSSVSSNPPTNAEDHSSNTNNGNNESSSSSPHVTPPYRASYASTDVLEVEVDGNPVMVRVKDMYVNGTQVIKVALLQHPDLSKDALHNEIIAGLHDISHEGPERCQGVWIPFGSAVSLCRKCHVLDQLKSLLDSIQSLSSSADKPDLTRTYSKMQQSENSTDGDTTIELPVKKQKLNEDGSKTLKLGDSELPPIKLFNVGQNPSAPFAMKSVAESDIDEKSKVVLSSLFLPNQKSVSLLELVGSDESQLKDLNVDVPIDDNGQTALHLASTLGRVSLVEDLISHGANRFRGDNDGQTALIRAVHATNCYEANCFPQLLDYLYPVICVLDHKGRTVLHHIAYTCGRKGCSDACQYYLETLLEWIVRRGPTLPSGQEITLKKFIQEVVNLPDRNGDTCLNIAAMVGNRHIIQQLLEIDADPTLANKAGVRPTDCGIGMDWQGKGKQQNQQSQTQQSQDKNSKSGEDGNSKGIDKHIEESDKKEAKIIPSETNNSVQILDSIQDFVTQLRRDFKQEMEQKTKQISSLHPMLREKTLQLSEKRRQHEELQKMVVVISDYRNKISNLNRAIQEEDQHFQEEAKTLPINSENFSGNFDADEPFTLWPVFNEVERIVEQKLAGNEETSGKDKKANAAEILEQIKPEDIIEQVKTNLKNDGSETSELPPKVVLEARIRAYEKNSRQLLQRMRARRSSSQELEKQFKRVISLCIGSKPEDIDEKLLGSLLLSVENDPDPEISQVKKVLEIVNDMEK